MSMIYWVIGSNVATFILAWMISRITRQTSDAGRTGTAGTRVGQDPGMGQLSHDLTGRTSCLV